MKEVDFCCCGCSLRAGTLILAVLELLAGGIGIIGSFTFASFDYFVSMAKAEGFEIPDVVITYFELVKYYLMFMSIVITIFAVVGLIGAANYKAGLVKIFGWFWILTWVVGGIYSIFQFVWSVQFCSWMCDFVNNSGEQGGTGLLLDCDNYVRMCKSQQMGAGIAGLVIGGLFSFYFAWVCFSFAAKLKRGEYQQLPTGQVVQAPQGTVVYQQAYAAPAPQGVVYQPQAGVPAQGQVPQQGVPASYPPVSQ